MSFFSTELAARVSQLTHHALRHQFRQPLQRAHISCHAQLGFLDGEIGIGGAIPAVSSAHQVQSPTNTAPVHGSQHGQTYFLQRAQSILQLQYDSSQVLRHTARITTHGHGFRIREHAQIHACGKVLPSRGDHNHPGIGIGFNVLNAARQLQPECLVHGIQRLGATELNMGDVVFYFNIETFVVGEFRHDGSRII